ncbi:MAG: hypothetical protein ABIE23_01830 [archaeon]
MKQISVIGVFLLFLVLLFVGCVEPQNDKNQGNNSVPESENNGLGNEQASNQPPSEQVSEYDNLDVNLSVSTDKNEYGSHEEAKITVTTYSSGNVQNVLVKVWGIAPYSENYIESEKTIDLVEGENIIEFVETTPYCTAGCGGVYPGPYGLHASIEYNRKELAKAETEITLTSH